MIQRLSIILLFFIPAILFTACGTGAKEGSEKEFLERTDHLGRKVKYKAQPKRFVPLASSLTEMLAAICDTAEIVSRTQNCDYPGFIITKPVVSNYPVDLERLVWMKPDLVFTKEGIVSLEQAARIEEMGIPVYYQKYHKAEDILNGLRELGEITGHTEKAKQVADSLEQEIEVYRKMAAAQTQHLKVLLVISSEQIYVYGRDSYATDLLNIAGAENAVDSVFTSDFPQVSSEYILQINPDVIIGGKYSGVDGSFFEVHPELKRTKAYKEKKCFMINEDLISRPSPRLVEAIAEFRKITQP